MRKLLTGLFVVIMCACGVPDESREETLLQQLEVERGWDVADPRLKDWILSVHEPFRGQGAGDQGAEEKPTSCRFNSARRCQTFADSPHPETSGCLWHRTPAFGWWKQTFHLVHCLDTPGCPIDANGDRPGDLTGIRVCHWDDTVPSPVWGQMTACGAAGREGCAVCSPPATPVCH